VVADPWHQARWWPRVQRVEGARDGRFTQVMISARGRPVRADFRVVEALEPQRLRWEQELEGSPFEPLLAEAVTQVALAPVDDGAATEVTVELRQQLRGWSRLVPFLFRRAARRQLAEALTGLAAVVSPPV